MYIDESMLTIIGGIFISAVVSSFTYGTIYATETGKELVKERITLIKHFTKICVGILVILRKHNS